MPLPSKEKIPVPVIEELLDELSGAAWFTKLDLRAGYHQIRLVAGEEYKMKAMLMSVRSTCAKKCPRKKTCAIFLKELFEGLVELICENRGRAYVIRRLIYGTNNFRPIKGI